MVAGLVSGAVLFAWVRSEQLVIAQRADVEPVRVIEETDAASFEWSDFGKQVYVANCQNCHTADGSGRSMYPPVQNMAAHFRVDGGREYLIDVVLYGAYGGTYGAPMPPMPELSDRQIAAVTNYMVTQFRAPNGAPASQALYIPPDVAERRGQESTERDVATTRPAIPSAEELGRGVKVPIKADSPAVPEGADR